MGILTYSLDALYSTLLCRGNSIRWDFASETRALFTYLLGTQRISFFGCDYIFSVRIHRRWCLTEDLMVCNNLINREGEANLVRKRLNLNYPYEKALFWLSQRGIEHLLAVVAATEAAGEYWEWRRLGNTNICQREQKQRQNRIEWRIRP